jgi:hypothetical protein
MATPTERKTARVAAAKLAAETRKAKKLHVIAERRAKAAKLTKAEFIAEIMKGTYRPITAADIAAEPDPEPDPKPEAVAAPDPVPASA